MKNLLLFILLSITVLPFAYGPVFAQEDHTQSAKTPPKGFPENKPEIITRVEPQYPSVAKAVGIGGTAFVRVTVNKQGDVITATIVNGHPLLRDAALIAALECKFNKSTESGAPERIGFVSFDFGSGDKLSSPPINHMDLDAAEELVKFHSSSPEAHYWLAVVLSGEEEFEEAIAEFKQAIELKPNYELAYVDLGQIYKKQNLIDQEIELYKQALKNKENSIQLLRLLASLLSTKNRYEEASEVVKRIIEINPDDYDAYTRLGFYQMRLQRHEASLEASLKALEIKPDYYTPYANLGLAYTTLNRLNDAEQIYLKALEVNPKQESPYLGLSSIYYMTNRNEEIVRISKQGLELVPNSQKLWYNLGAGLTRLQRREEAIEAYRRAIEIDPNYARAYSLMGFNLYRLGHLIEADEALKKAVKLNPNDALSLHNLAAVSFSMGRLSEAVSLYKKAAQFKEYTDQFKVYREMAWAYAQLHRYQDAIDALRQSIKIKPDVAETHINLAYVLGQAGNFAEAETEYKAALELEPNNHAALNGLGYHYVERNEKLNEALAMIQRAVDALPNNHHYLDSLGWAYYKLGQLEKAETYLLQASQNGAKESIIYEHLGDVYKDRGKIELAKAAWQKALSLTSRPDETARIKGKIGEENKN